MNPTTPPRPDPGKPKLRWHQFGLRTLLIFVTLCGLWCSYELSVIHKRAAAAAMIERLGGYVDYDFRHRFDDEHPYDSCAEPPGLKFARQVFGEYYAANVVEVQLFSGPGGMRPATPRLFTDAQAEQLAILTEVRWLVLRDTQMTDRGLQNFKGMKHLGRLDLEGTPVTAAGVKELQRSLPSTRIYFDGDNTPDQ